MSRPLFPQYFSHSLKREITELYASTAIADLALAMVILFEPVYFITVLKWSVPQVLLFFAAVYFFYIIFIPLGGKITARFGYEHTMLYSIPFQIGYWFALFLAPVSPILVFAAAPILAIQKSLFWPAYHSDMGRFSDADQRSREYSGIFALSHLVYIVGPFVGGFLAESFGLRALLVVASCIYFCMFIPMFTTPEVFTRKPYRFRTTLSYYKKFPREALAYAGFGDELILLVVWPIFIFFTVKYLFGFGLVIAASTLIATLVMLYVGKLSDFGKRKLAERTGAFWTVVIWFGRIWSGTAMLVLVADVFSRIFRDSFFVAIVSNIYDRANEEHILPYIIFFEQALSIGKLVAALLGAALFVLTNSFAPLFIMAAIFACFYLQLPIRAKIPANT